MIANKSSWMLVPMVALLITANTLPAVAVQDQGNSDQDAAVMLILRGAADSENPRGQLDDGAALEYARRLGFRGEVLDVAGAGRVHSEQHAMAMDRIHQDETVAAIYGFSAGGYNARLIWKKLTAGERERIEKVIVVGSPGVVSTDFPGTAEVVIEDDPPEGHLAGPKTLLNKTLLKSLDAGRAVPRDTAKRSTAARRSSEERPARKTRGVRAIASDGDAGTSRKRTRRDTSARPPEQGREKSDASQTDGDGINPK